MEEKKKIISAYQSLFDASNESVRIVKSDLADFCYLLQSTTQSDDSKKVDPIATARMEGRREVMLHILKYMNVNLAQLELMIQAQEQEARKWK